MMPDGIRAILEREESPEHRRWVEIARRRVQASHRCMSQRHEAWRQAEQTDRTFRPADEQDRRTKTNSVTRGVQKIVVPYSYAQLRALLAFFMSAYTQRTPIIPVQGMGPGDARAAIFHELILEFQCANMMPRFPLVLYQWLFDAARYGIGIVRNSWTIREWPDMVRKVTPILDPMGNPTGYDDQIETRDVIAYEGNEMLNVSPFKWYPDPNVPMGQFQTGEFCAHEYELSWTRMEQLAAEGLRAGLDYVPRGSSSERDFQHGNAKSDLPRITGMSDLEPWPRDEYGMPYTENFDVFVFLHPEQLAQDRFSLRDEDGTPATKWRAPRLFVFTLTNMNRITRLEPANLPGRRYPYEAIELNYDAHSPANIGFTEVTAGLNDHFSWLFNSRMQAVRRTATGLTVIDPSMVEERDIVGEEAEEIGGYVRLKRQHWQSGQIRDAFFPIPFQDVTQGHVSVDAPVVRDFMDLALGLPPPVLGMVNKGRRSATEVQSTLTAASGRGKMLMEIANHQGLGPLVMQCIRNNQMFLDETVLQLRAPYNRLFGQPGLPMNQIRVTPDMLQGDFIVPLGELGIPNDKQMEAGVWKELIMQAMQAGAMPPLPPEFFQIAIARFLYAMNIRDIQSAGLTMAQLSVVPDEQVQQQVQAGNLVQAQPTGPTSDGFPMPPQNAIPPGPAGSALGGLGANGNGNGMMA